MFHGFYYPDEVGGETLYARFAHIVMRDGVIRFDRPEQCTVRKPMRTMSVKAFGLGSSVRSVKEEWSELEKQL